MNKYNKLPAKAEVKCYLEKVQDFKAVVIIL